MIATPTSMQVMTLNLPMEFYLIYVPWFLFYWTTMITLGIGFGAFLISVIENRRKGE